MSIPLLILVLMPLSIQVLMPLSINALVDTVLNTGTPSPYQCLYRTEVNSVFNAGVNTGIIDIINTGVNLYIVAQYMQSSNQNCRMSKFWKKQVGICETQVGPNRHQSRIFAKLGEPEVTKFGQKYQKTPLKV